MLSNMYPRSLHSHCNIYPVVYDNMPSGVQVSHTCV